MLSSFSSFPLREEMSYDRYHTRDDVNPMGSNIMSNETVTDRIARLKLEDIGETRLALLTEAHSLVDDTTFARISDAMRVAKSMTVVLPAHRYEGLSRGKGWARQGVGKSAVWGERVSGGYRVGPGRWTVGGNDGFRRKGETEWNVEHVTVGGETWTIAD